MQSPDRPMTIEPAEKRWRAYFAGHLIADTDDALIVREPGHDPVVYFPREDVSMEYMSRTDRHTRCPHKGEAAYYSLLMDGHWAENGVWTYEQPVEGAEQLRARLAFDQNHIEVYEISDEELHKPHHMDRREVDDAVQHTDSGAGASQKEHWPANVDRPHEPR